MNRKALLVYVAVPIAVIAGAATYHRSQRNRELDHQAAVKGEGSVPVTLVAVQERSFRPAVAFTGTLLAVNRAELKAEVVGRVTRVAVQEGDAVAAGALLGAQDEDDYVLGMQAAEAQVAQAQAGVTALKANIAYTQIRAPFAGVVQSRKVNEGDFVGPGMPLLELVGDGEQELVATLSEAEAKGLKAGTKLAFESEGAEGQAQVTGLAPGGDPYSHKGTLRAKVLRPRGLRQGSFARILVPGLPGIQGLSVPRSAIVQRGELTGVFLAKEGHAELRWLSMGEGDGPYLSVRAGLKDGEKVIDHPGALQDGQPIEVSTGVSHGK